MPGREKLEAFFAPFGEEWGVQHGAMDSGALLLLVLLRWFAIIALCPFFGGRLVPGSVKIILAFLMAWQTDFTLDPYDVFHSSGIEGKYNAGSFSDPRVDDLIERGTTARSPEEALPIWREYQEVLHREQPYTILYELEYSVGASARIRGMEIDVRGMLAGIEDWWIAPGDRKYAS